MGHRCIGQGRIDDLPIHPRVRRADIVVDARLREGDSLTLFDLTQPTIYNPAFVTLQGGIPQAEAALIAGIEGGESYFNIHTVMFGGEEIRTSSGASWFGARALVLLGSALIGLM